MMKESNIKQILKNVIYELSMGPPVHVASLFKFLRIFPKRKKRTWLSEYLSDCQRATASPQARVEAFPIVQDFLQNRQWRIHPKDWN